MPRPQAELLCAVSAVRAGDSFTVAIRVTPEPGWHTYWINPGDAGAPLTVTWRLPEGMTAGPLEWPAPERLEEDGLVSFAYERELVCLVTLTTPATLPAGTNLEVRASLTWMVCKEMCVPHELEVSTRIRVGDTTVRGDLVAAAAIDAARQALPAVADGWQFRAALTEQAVRVHVTPPAGVDVAMVTQAAFFPEARGLIDLAQASRWQAADGRATLELVRSGVAPPPGPLRGILAWPDRGTGALGALLVVAEWDP